MKHLRIALACFVVLLASFSAKPALADFPGGIIAGCNTPISIPINVATSGLTQLVALSAGQQIHVCHMDFISNGATSVQFEYGTGTSCATGTTALTGPYPSVAESGLSAGNGNAAVMVVPAGQALCINLSAAVQVSGLLTYTVY
jgi:hypothetical protein